MAWIGIVVITVVMACAVAGAVASLFDSEKGLGKEFLDGLYAIGYIFVPVAGVMASIPYLSTFVREVVGPAFEWIGADPAMAATSVIAVDMGGYQLAGRLADTKEGWMMAMVTGCMAGATIVFSIPVGLRLLDKRDHKYMALGVMAGLLSIPVGVLVSSVVMILFHPEVNSTSTGMSGPLDLTLHAALLNLAPLAALVTLLALGLRLAPDAMIRGFMWFGRFITVATTLVLVTSIVEHFTRSFYGTGLFTLVLGEWEFDPLFANFEQIKGKFENRQPLEEEDIMRALEVAGNIGLMLSGAFPMVYLIKKYLAGPMERVGGKLGLGAAGAAGILAAAANILAMFHLIKDMRAKDKVLNIAFAVCAAFLFGDHLAFTAGFQPGMLLPVMVGKLSGGVCGFALAYWLCVPKALEMERQDCEREEAERTRQEQATHDLREEGANDGRADA
jgi:ethanolamine transporter